MSALIWLLVAIILTGAELFVGEMTLLMLGLSALATAGVTALGAPVWGQVICFALVSLLLLFLAKPALKRKMMKTPVLDTSVKALEGASATVIEPVTANSGQVRLDGSIWTARPLDPTETLSEGELVQVVTIDGSTAIVWKGI